MTAGVLSLACLAADRGRTVAFVWLTVACATTVFLAVGGATTLGAALATASGQLLALTALALVAGRALRIPDERAGTVDPGRARPGTR
jgi:hypothetical protein